MISKLPWFLLALWVSACATSTPRVWTSTTEPALLVQNDALELRVRDGRVFVVAAGVPGQSARERLIDDPLELRHLYEDITGAAWSPLPDGGAIQINGWSGLTCLRPGESCGPAPEGAPRALIVVRFER